MCGDLSTDDHLVIKATGELFYMVTELLTYIHATRKICHVNLDLPWRDGLLR